MKISLGSLARLIPFIFILISLSLGIHNALLYHPSNGFDGYGHTEYVDYIAKNWKLPAPTAWETHQAPLYYIVAGVVQDIFKTQKAVQFINIAVFWGIVVVVSLGLRRVFKKNMPVFFGALSLVSLPMLNIFQPTITNELLSTFWIICSLISGIYLLTETGKKSKKYFILMLTSVVLGIWTKVSMISIIPVLLFIILLSFKNRKVAVKKSLILLAIFSLAYTPIYIRASNTSSPSNITKVASQIKPSRSLDFYFRLDWIPKIDMYTTQYYSLLGGAFNSFFTDGHNATTPFVTFHKKSLILWLLGFFLLPVSVYGQIKLLKENKKVGIVVLATGISMFVLYIFYNIASPHYSAARLTYEMAIVVPYSFGIASAIRNKKISLLISIALVIQFITLVSFFWIEPWWFVTSPKKLQ